MRETFRFLLVSFLLASGGAASAGPMLGPVTGIVEAADGATVDDLVVRLNCRGNGIHGTHLTDEESRVVATGKKFRFVWTYRGISPAGCSLEVHHPRYFSAYRSLNDDFTQNVGKISLETWDAFLDAGPGDSPADSSHPWPRMEFFQYLACLEYHYIPAFSERKRPELGRYVPHIHRLFARVIATGAYGGNERHSGNSPMHRIRDIEGTLRFAGAQTALFAAAAADDPGRIRKVAAAGAWLDSWDDEGYSPLNQAVRDDKVRAARVLLELGADPNWPHSRQVSQPARAGGSCGNTARILRVHAAGTAHGLVERAKREACSSRTLSRFTSGEF